MPELPDVQVFREYLDATSLHHRIDRVRLSGAGRMLERVSARTLRARLRRRRLDSTERHGKNLFVAIHGGVGQGYGRVSWGVRAIWEGYAGWFHQRSTTELYAVPATEVYPDVVGLAGGATRVAERAMERLAHGEAVAAIHLAEVALGADPASRPALEVYLAAHEQLLAERGGENFWETGWLRHQIAQTRRALEASRA